MTADDEPRFATRSLHAGQQADPATGALATPLYQTTSYAFDSADHAADLYALDADGDVYSRISNPTVRVLEERLADLAGAVNAVATASGMAALDSVTTILAHAGDNVVASTDMYGGTSTYLSKTASRRGVELRTVDTLDYDAYENVIDDDTAFVHVETLANPSLVTPDFERLADVAHDHAVPLVVDNTFATPALCRPLEHGADVVWESTTKWIHGSGTTVGGIVLDGGTFPWDHPDADYPELSGENPAWGFDFTERFGREAFGRAIRQRAVRTLGNQQSPFDAWQTLQGLETLPLRFEKHCENARLVAEHLRDHPDVAWVTYPGFDDHPTHENATDYLDSGFGGMLAFGLAGIDDAEQPGDDDAADAADATGTTGTTGTTASVDGFAVGKAFCEHVDLASFLANIGDAKTLVIHPASTTHAQLSRAEQRAAGVRPDLLRLSVGIEDPVDITADIDQAITVARAELGASAGTGHATDGGAR